MNKLIKLGCIALAGSLLFSCETDPEKLEIVKPYPKSDQYYANLRDYKNSDHEIVFGWFGFWSGTGASASNYMKSLPDSVDMVGLWGGWYDVTDAQRADMRDSQQKRGLKVIATTLLDGFDMGVAPDGATAPTEEEMLAYWGWEGSYRTRGDENLTEGNIAAIKKFAHALCQRVIDNGYDGLDIDNEPNVGGGKKPYGISGFPGRYKVFMDVVVTYFGRTSGTGRLLAIDGELTANMDPKYGECFHYFIAQAYSSYGDSDLDGRLSTVINHYSDIPAKDLASRFIVTENFENITYRTNGGANYTTRDGESMKSLAGMAQWQPIIDGEKVKKGGCGTYHMEYEYRNPKPYKFLMEAIQIQNPARK